MKIRNFAFFGVMASILAVSAANAVETTRQLATKAYVDNKAADANYRSNANYANNTIGKAIQDLASSTESSLTTAIGSLDADLNATQDHVVTGVTQVDGVITSVDSSQVSEAMLDSSLGAKVDSYDTHIADDVSHITAAERTSWDGKQDAADRVQTLGAATTAEEKAAKYPSVAAVELAVSSANSTALDALDGHNAVSSTGVSAGAAADQGKEGWAVVSVVQSNGDVTSTLGQLDNRAVATGANIDYAKMNAGIVNLDDQTATCSTTNPCMLTYVGNNTYKWTNMIETADETLTAVQQQQGGGE